MNDFEIALDHYVNLAIDDGLAWPTTLQARKQLLQYVRQGFPTPYISALAKVQHAYQSGVSLKREEDTKNEQNENDRLPDVLLPRHPVR